jgi:hypothetical protein
MKTVPIKPAACYGIGCNQHTLCARYHAIEGSAPGDHRDPSCEGGKGFQPAIGPVPQGIEEDVYRQILWGNG